LTGSQPLVSIVTPSYNAARFLSESIESVLAQSYPRIEYVLMDGGSSDATPVVLDRYRDRVARVSSRADAGQAEAINTGIASTAGEIVAFLNADDRYLPNAVEQAVRAFEAHPDAGVVYGNAYHIDDRGATIGPYPTEDFDAARLKRACFICQPAAFVRRDAFEAAGGLNPQLHYALDYDLWMRLAAAGKRFVRIEPFLAESRVHPASKSAGNRSAFYREVHAVLKRRFGYVPYEWVQGYASYLCGHRDQFASRRPPNTAVAAAACLALGVWTNRRRTATFVADWLAHRSAGKKLIRGA